MKVIFLDIDGVLNSDAYSDSNGYNFGEGLLPKDVDEIIKRLGRKREKEEERSKNRIERERNEGREKKEKRKEEEERKRKREIKK